ncbi:MAG: hypothetical protein AAFQ36_06830 [Pseudomonadota bacterium]
MVEGAPPDLFLTEAVAPLQYTAAWLNHTRGGEQARTDVRFAFEVVDGETALCGFVARERGYSDDGQAIAARSEFFIEAEALVNNQPVVTDLSFQLSGSVERAACRWASDPFDATSAADAERLTPLLYTRFPARVASGERQSSF